MLTSFYEWHENRFLTEMAARRSFTRLLSKFAQDISKPAAILTAFRGDLRTKSGEPLTTADALAKNRDANRALESEIRRRGLSLFPVEGAGPEDSESGMTVRREEGYLVQPREEMNEQIFLQTIKELLLNAANPDHRQWGAVVKLPSRTEIFFLNHNGEASSTSDYELNHAGDSVRAKKPYFVGLSDEDPKQGDPFYTQMRKGPLSTEPPDDLDQLATFPLRRRFVIGKS